MLYCYTEVILFRHKYETILSSDLVTQACVEDFELVGVQPYRKNLVYPWHKLTQYRHMLNMHMLWDLTNARHIWKGSSPVYRFMIPILANPKIDLTQRESYRELHNIHTKLVTCICHY